MPIHNDDDLDPEDAGPTSADDMTADDATLLDRYLSGESSPDEDEIVRSRFGDDLRPRIVAAFAATEPSAPVDSAVAWRNVKARASGASTASLRDIGVARKQRIWQSTGFRIAASLLLLAGAGAVARQLSTIRQASYDHVAQTVTGERREVVLPDGSRVTLAPKSRLAYAATFATGPRDVQLTGEAFFTVTHDAKHPFVVHTSGATARDLGTEFGVRARAGQSVNVYVASGRVLVAPPAAASGPVLRAGDLARVDVGAGPEQIVVTHNVAIGDYLAWRDGRVVATSRPAAEVLDELGRWYDARFSTPNSALASRSVSVDLRVGNGVSLESVLDALMLTLDARYERNGQTITVSPR
jgi:ferric-dicitrate binding protein FerR (iron transport regulator)